MLDALILREFLEKRGYNPEIILEVRFLSGVPSEKIGTFALPTKVLLSF